MASRSLPHRWLLPCLLLLAASPAAAAPAVSEVMSAGDAPPRGPVGQPVVIFASGLATPVRVFFSNGVSPTVEAASVAVDTGRGIVLARVPAGAVSGGAKVRANGVDSPLFYFRVEGGAFVQGNYDVSGQVTSGGSPVANAIVLLLRPGACEGMTLWDWDTTGAGGNYNLQGGAGEHALLVFPRTTAGLATSLASVTLGPAPVVQDVALLAGTTLTGRVVDAAAPATGIDGARVEIEADSGFELVLTDAAGNFSAQVMPGDGEIKVTPPASSALAFFETDVTVGAISPQSVGDLPLPGGVKVSGTVARAADGRPLPGARISAYEQGTCCSYADDKKAGGDGSYALYVPGNRTYSLEVRFDDDGDLVDVQAGALVVGVSDQVLDVDAEDAAIIEGTVRRLPGGSPIEGQSVGASGAGSAWTGTCADGSYRLRVLPDAGGYTVSTADNWNGEQHASKTWNGTPGGGYYPCEATPVAAAAPGALTQGVDFQLPLAASIQGRVSTQANGCADDLGDADGRIVVDDGPGHACSMGVPDASFGPGGYRIMRLPPASAGPPLRACVTREGFDAQCYNLKDPPEYDAIIVSEGETASGIDFCLAACTPETWYPDADGDGHGTAAGSLPACTQPDGYLAGSDDCDDTRPSVYPGATEACGNLIDDDCDGSTDEAGCVNVCPDADGDGYAVCGGCNLDAGDACGDCDDASAGTHPGASDANCNGADDDCDGADDDGFVSQATACGVGACARAGSTSCQGGVVDDSCLPGAPAPGDATCDAVDDDCNGVEDDGYVPLETNCGTGACASTGTATCVAGAVFDSCDPGSPAAEVCDGDDDDCNGTDDDPCARLLAPADLAVVPAAAPPTFSWTPGSLYKFQIEFSRTASPFVVSLRSWKGFKPLTAWVPGGGKWTKLKALGAGGAPVYWRVVGKPAGSSTKIVSEVFSLTIAP